MIMQKEAAETIAIQVFGWMAARDDIMGAFLDAAGSDAGAIRLRVQEPEFLGFLLDFLMTSDDMVLEFAQTNGHRPEALQAARMALPGGDLPNWT